MSLIRVNMSIGAIDREEFSKDAVIGGRGMIDHLMTKYGSPSVHPLSEESLFIVAPGLLCGTIAPQSGRLSIGGKSPLTGGIKEANVGGTAGHKLGRVGIHALMVTGRSREWQVLRIDGRDAILERAGDIVGKGNYATCQMLRKRFGEKVGIIIIGPAGEMKSLNSTVGVTDLTGRPCRHAARGGVGAIMGSKGLKAIIIDDKEGPFRRPYDEERFKAAVKKAVETIKDNPFTEVLHTLGTPCFVFSDNERGSLPTHNHRMGSFEKYENINAGRIIELNKARGGSMGHGCMPGCIVRCSYDFNDPAGNFSTAALEYETLAMLGSNLGIDDLDAIARMDRRCDELGIDTIEMGATIGIMHDCDLFDFGDAERAEAYLDEIAKKTPMGRILGSGVTVAAKVFGIDRVPAIKGQGIPAHAARALKGWGVTYATSPQGADHSAGCVTEEPLSPVGHTKRSRNAQISSAALDSTGLCLFSFLEETPEVIVLMINAFYGVNWNVSDYLEMGKEMLRQERDFNRKAGIGKEQDRIPDWMRKEPLPPTNAVFDVSQEDIDDVFND